MLGTEISFMLTTFDFQQLECAGQPLAMFQFQDNPQAYPSQYKKIRQTWKHFQCGSNPLEMASGCCTSFLDSSSGSTLYLDDSNFPASAINSTYCKLKTEKYSQFYLLDNGYCVQGYKCFDDTLWAFKDLNCSGTAQIMPLNETSTKFNDIKARIVRITNGTARIDWKAFLPEYVVVPDTNHISYDIGLMFYTLAILSTLYILGFYSLR